MEYPTNTSEFVSLTLQAIEGRITDDDFARLEKYLQDKPEFRDIYSDLNIMYAYLRRPALTFDADVHESEQYDPLDAELWQHLAEYEKTAPRFELSEEEPSQELIQKVVHARNPYKISKFNIFTFAISAAAIFLILLFIKFAPTKRYSVEVATLIDQVNVKWADSRSQLDNGSRLLTNDLPFVLDKGIISILYDNDVEVVIEAPAKFELEQSGVILEYGRLFSRVSESGLGFRVETPTCQFVDLGTEFGIQADINGSSELHVIKGKVQLFAGAAKEKKTSLTVQVDDAIRYDANRSQVSNIPIQKTVFARQVNSKSNFIWRGQKVINLADIVGEGNGFGTGTVDHGLNLLTGKSERVIKLDSAWDKNGQYRVTSNPYVDGVFVPRGGLFPVQVSSTGLRFDECPKTSGYSYRYIFNGAWHSHIEGEPPHLLKLNDLTFEKTGQALYMHSNAGITFDLEAIRRGTPGLRINRFKATAGVSQTVLEIWPKSSRVDFWVLVDGQIRLEQIDAKPEDGSFKIEIDLLNKDRFLTIITTDSGSEYEGGSRDWALLADPVLELDDEK